MQIVRWVKFDNGEKDRLIELVITAKAEAKSKMEFVALVRDTFEISLTDAGIVADNFYKND